MPASVTLYRQKLQLCTEMTDHVSISINSNYSITYETAEFCITHRAQYPTQLQQAYVANMTGYEGKEVRF